jgi:predicted nucleotidyltransferase
MVTVMLILSSSSPDNMHYTTYADDYFTLADALENLLKKSVDLVTEKTLKNPYLIENINRHKLQLI